jgi:opacity protein-like surface antigen
MKRSSIVLLCFIALAAVFARGQVVPSAESRRFSLSVGVMGSVFQPNFDADYENPAVDAPIRSYGLGGYVDMKLSRWVRLEFEGRSLRFNEYEEAAQDTYLGGFNIPLHRFGRFTPYAKALGGAGVLSSPYIAGSQVTAFTFAYGGGVDYRLSKRFSLRADYEEQRWRTDPVIQPFGASAGISYKIF